MMEFSDSSKGGQQAAMLDDHKKISNSGDGDAIRGDDAGRRGYREEGRK